MSADIRVSYQMTTLVHLTFTENALETDSVCGPGYT